VVASVERIEDWLGQEVFDSAGERLGKLEEVFYSTATGEAVFASLKSGLFGRHGSVVPLAGASVGRDYLRLAYTAEQIERAGGDGAPESLDREEAARLGQGYGVELPAEDDYESASAAAERLRNAEEARRKAEELEAEARQREEAAENAASAVRSAGEQAADTVEQARHARTEADRARAEADRIERSDPSDI
jgi:PRC-barrel domain